MVAATGESSSRLSSRRSSEHHESVTIPSSASLTTTTLSIGMFPWRTTFLKWTAPASSPASYSTAWRPPRSRRRCKQTLTGLNILRFNVVSVQLECLERRAQFKRAFSNCGTAVIKWNNGSFYNKRGIAKANWEPSTSGGRRQTVRHHAESVLPAAQVPAKWRSSVCLCAVAWNAFGDHLSRVAWRHPHGDLEWVRLRAPGNTSSGDRQESPRVVCLKTSSLRLPSRYQRDRTDRVDFRSCILIRCL